MITDRKVRDEINQLRRTAARAQQEYQTLVAMVADMTKIVATGGQAPVPGISLIGTEIDLVVNLKKPLPNSNYECVAQPFSTLPSLVAAVSVIGVIGQGTSSVVVRVRANSVIAIGSGVVINVIAIWHA